MANNESTAVNDLIKIATTQKPLTPDPTEDLMFAAPQNARSPRMRTGMQPSTGADVAPLPRGRAPHGTQQNASVGLPPPLPAISRTSSRSIAVPPPLPAVARTMTPVEARVSSRSIAVPPPMPVVARTMTPTPSDGPAVARTMTPTTSPVSSRSIAVPPPPPTASRTITVPPVPPTISRGMLAVSVDGDATAPSSLQFADGSIDVAMDTPTEAAADEPIASRVTRPSIPAMPAMPAMPALAARTSALHVPPPSGPRTTTLAPVIVPPPAAIEMTGSPWFDDSRTVDRVSSPFVPQPLVEGTAQVARPRTQLEWLAKLAPVMGIAVIVGVCVGGFLVFDGAGGKKRSAQPATAVVAGAMPMAADEQDDVAAPDPLAPVDVAPAAVVASVPAAAEPAADVVAEPASVAEVKVTVDDSAPTPVTPPNLAAMMPTTSAPAPAAEPASPPVAVPSITAAAATAKRVALVDIRIDSKPAGATVMLLDRGKTTFLGTTPISTAVDPSRAYEVVLTYGTRPSQREHLDPKTTQRLAVEITRSGRRVKPEVAKVAKVAIAAPAIKATKATPVKFAKLAEPTWDAPAAKPAKATKTAAIETTGPVKAEVATRAVAGDGLLMISSKPPCEIHVDGKATGLMTPQRAMKLPAGKHTITLVNAAESIKKTISVSISPDAPTKVIQDLMKP